LEKYYVVLDATPSIIDEYITISIAPKNPNVNIAKMRYDYTAPDFAPK
jgi:hypothetical protein